MPNKKEYDTSCVRNQNTNCFIETASGFSRQLPTVEEIEAELAGSGTFETRTEEEQDLKTELANSPTGCRTIFMMMAELPRSIV